MQCKLESFELYEMKMLKGAFRNKVRLFVRIKVGTSLVAQSVKRLPTMWETWVQSLGRADLLEKGMATHSSTLA